MYVCMQIILRRMTSDDSSKGGIRGCGLRGDNTGSGEPVIRGGVDFGVLHQCGEWRGKERVGPKIERA